jgi:tetratricopeptide (TPR) repeat protein
LPQPGPLASLQEEQPQQEVTTATALPSDAPTDAHQQAQQLRDSRSAFEQARLAVNIGKPRTALTLLAGCLEAEPDHPEYLGLYGYAMALEGTDLDVALRVCQHAVEARSYDASLHAQLGYVYQAKGMAVRARECYEAARQRDPLNTVASDGLLSLKAPRSGFSLRSLLRFLRH